MRFALGTVILFRMDVETKADPLEIEPEALTPNTSGGCTRAKGRTRPERWTDSDIPNVPRAVVGCLALATFATTKR
jgi:hypothetical protein